MTPTHGTVILTAIGTAGAASQSPMPSIIFQWGLSSHYGWGVYGINLMLNWPNGGGGIAVPSGAFAPEHIALNPLEWLRAKPALVEAARLQQELARAKGHLVEASVPVLHCMGNGLHVGRSVHDVTLIGKPTFGVAFLERTELDDAARERARAYRSIFAGSSWCEQVLRAAGIDNVQTLLQGIDPSLFHPAPRRGLFADRFVVFSGGKLEARKGQDLVLQAFRVFAERHPEALLVTAWHSPWPQLAASLAQANPAVAAPPSRDGQVDAAGWAAANGIAPHQFLDLGPLPNAQMPRILREMDVALFPNRCEGGTNLVAMECMACGVPTILSANSGHLDLIGADNCFVLTRQRRSIHDGWSESDIDEIIVTLETAFQDRERARTTGLKGADTLAALSWQRQIGALAVAVTG